MMLAHNLVFLPRLPHAQQCKALAVRRELLPDGEAVPWPPARCTCGHPHLEEVTHHTNPHKLTVERVSSEGEIFHEHIMFF